MKVSDLLKGKKAYQKEYMLKDEDLETEVVDKLVADPAKSVREIAVRHKKASQSALLKAATAKKNMEEKWILRGIFWRLDADHKWEFLKAKSWKLFEKTYVFEEIDTEFWTGIEKTANKDALTALFKEEFMGGEHFAFIRKWLLKFVDLKKDKELYGYFLEKFPEKLVMYREEQGFTPEQFDQQFKQYLETSGKYWASPRNDLGYGVLPELTKPQLDLLIDRKLRLTKDDLDAILSNPNLTADHTEQIFDAANDWNEVVAFLITKFPLNKKVEDKLYDWISTKTERNGHWKILEALAINPSHTKDRLLKLMSEWETDQGWSINVIDNMLKTGKYTEADLDAIYANKSDYYKDDIDKFLIDNPNFPKARLEKLWKEHWPKWNSKKVEGPLRTNTFSGPDFERFGMSKEDARRNHILYYLLKDSAMNVEFATEYYNDTGDDTFLPQVAKDIFLF